MDKKPKCGYCQDNWQARGYCPVCIDEEKMIAYLDREGIKWSYKDGRKKNK